MTEPEPTTEEVERVYREQLAKVLAGRAPAWWYRCESPDVLERRMIGRGPRDAEGAESPGAAYYRGRFGGRRRNGKVF